MHLTLQQLKLFEAVSRLGSYTRAAEELCITQPAVSIQIKRMEEQVGLALFEQVGKKTFPTAAGKTMYDASVDILNRVEELKISIENRFTSFLSLSFGLKFNHHSQDNFADALD